VCERGIWPSGTLPSLSPGLPGKATCLYKFCNKRCRHRHHPPTNSSRSSASSASRLFPKDKTETKGMVARKSRGLRWKRVSVLPDRCSF